MKLVKAEPDCFCEYQTDSGECFGPAVYYDIDVDIENTRTPAFFCEEHRPDLIPIPNPCWDKPEVTE